VLTDRHDDLAAFYTFAHRSRRLSEFYVETRSLLPSQLCQSGSDSSMSRSPFAPFYFGFSPRSPHRVAEFFGGTRSVASACASIQ